WNFFLNSDFRSSERLGNRIKFGELESNSRFWLVTCTPSDRRYFRIASLISAFALHERPESYIKFNELESRSGVSAGQLRTNLGPGFRNRFLVPVSLFQGNPTTVPSPMNLSQLRVGGLVSAS
ncbi:hypothetical protein, partial [Mycobacteroides abscessus]